MEENIGKNIEHIDNPKNLNEEDVNKILIYSSKLRELSELDPSLKTDEMIQLEKEIKEKYKEIKTKFLLEQKYKNLLKNKDIKLNRKILKILMEARNEEDEYEYDYIIKTKEKRKNENIYSENHIKIDSSEDEDTEKTKRLIYDNSYLFKKDKDANEINIRQEVLDIL